MRAPTLCWAVTGTTRSVAAKAQTSSTAARAWTWLGISTGRAAIIIDLLTPNLNTGNAVGDVFVSIEGIVGTNFSDTLSGDNAANEIFGGVFETATGADILFGRGGNDILHGDGGNDRLDGGTGADTGRRQRQRRLYCGPRLTSSSKPRTTAMRTA